MVGAVHEALPMFHALCGDPRVDLVALATLPASASSVPAGFVDLAALAAPLGIPVLDGSRLGSPDVVAALTALDLDLMVVCGWTKLVPPAALAAARRGCVGFHASMLPRHRGRAPVNWAIINGERETGATMLMLDAGVDTGTILDQRPISIGVTDTCGTVYARVAAAGVAMFSELLPALLAGTARGVVQDPDAGDVLPRRTPEMGITDWNRSPAQVHDWVRALTHPYPGAFSVFDDRVLRLWRAEPAAPTSREDPPGVVLGCDDRGVVVAVRDGTVRLLSVQDGAEEVPATQWYRDALVRPGCRFAPVDVATSRWARGLGPVPAPLQSRAAR